MKFFCASLFFMLLAFGLASLIKEENLEDYELEFDLDEYFEEMTVDNIQPRRTIDDDLVGMETINEDKRDPYESMEICPYPPEDLIRKEFNNNARWSCFRVKLQPRGNRDSSSESLLSCLCYSSETILFP